ncbi:MAG: hypothetical protein P4L75_03395 [Clostridia bacterium]|nr:hypothetical protein [Clostridia bacterium]
MKIFRRIAALLLVLLVSVVPVSCAKKGDALKSEAAKQLSRGFECTAAVTWNGSSYQVKLARPSSGVCTMSFIKPAELSALSFELGKDGLKVKFGQLEASIDPTSLPQTALFNTILGALDEAASPTGVHAAAAANGGYRITGKTQAGSFTLMLGPDFKPRSLAFSGLNLSADFKDFKFS